MKFKDLFVPKILHSDPEVRKKAVLKINDPNLLSQVTQKDADESVRQLAKSRLEEIKK